METQANNNVSKVKNELIDMLDGVVLPEMSGVDEQCIYRVPQRIRHSNPQGYTPQTISIGPFHSPHGSISANNNLHEMEELKLKYLKGFLNRTKLCVDDLVFKLEEWENKIRNCYAGFISFDSKDFLKIIIVDACFIIEHFLRVFSYKDWKDKDPILSKGRLVHDICYDLLLLENQLPFFVLEEIYKFANINLELIPPFIKITMHYFHRFNGQNINPEGLLPLPKHFTDLMRIFLLSSSLDFAQEESENPIELLYNASQLSEAGLVFEASESKCLFDLKLDKGVLKMPRFHVHHGTETSIRNTMTFEECHLSLQDSTIISQYIAILDFLINTEKDVSILVDKKIIVNWMSDPNEVATIFATMSQYLDSIQSMYLCVMG